MPKYENQCPKQESKKTRREGTVQEQVNANGKYSATVEPQETTGRGLISEGVGQCTREVRGGGCHFSDIDIGFALFKNHLPLPKSLGAKTVLGEFGSHLDCDVERPGPRSVRC